VLTTSLGSIPGSLTRRRALAHLANRGFEVTLTPTA